MCMRTWSYGQAYVHTNASMYTWTYTYIRTHAHAPHTCTYRSTCISDRHKQKTQTFIYNTNTYQYTNNTDIQIHIHIIDIRTYTYMYMDTHTACTCIHLYIHIELEAKQRELQGSEGLSRRLFSLCVGVNVYVCMWVCDVYTCRCAHVSTYTRKAHTHTHEANKQRSEEQAAHVLTDRCSVAALGSRYWLSVYLAEFSPAVPMCVHVRRGVSEYGCAKVCVRQEAYNTQVHIRAHHTTHKYTWIHTTHIPERDRLVRWVFCEASFVLFCTMAS